MKLKIKKIHDDATIPSYAHGDSDSGMDVYAMEESTLYGNQSKLVKTGLSFEIPLGYEIQVRPKSGIALKHKVTVLNTPGTIDAGYRGELSVILINHGSLEYKIEKGQKIAQIVIAKVEHPEIEIAEELSDSSRGEGGFGSTGK